MSKGGGLGLPCLMQYFSYILAVSKSTFCKHRFPGNTLTHSTNEDLLNIKRKGDPEVSSSLVRNDNLNKGTTARMNETRFGPKKKSSPIYLGPKNLDTF
jgi:hypothetical protein